MASNNPVSDYQPYLVFLSERYGLDKIKEKREILMFDGTVNGYHHFGIRPLIGTDMPLLLREEDDNIYDPNAITVEVPEESVFDNIDMERETKPGQRVRDVIGQVCGRVPKNQGHVIKQGIQEGFVTHAFAFHKGGFVHAGKNRGGGPQLKCVYVIFVKRSKASYFRNALQYTGANVFSF